MFFEIFELQDDELVIAKKEVFLHDEFKEIWEDTNFLKCPDDKSGKNKLKAYRVFKFIWLAYDYKSEYQELPEDMRIETSRRDAELEVKDINSTLVKAAVAKYNKLQDTRLLRMLRTSQRTLDKVDDFLNDIDLNEKDDSNRYVHKLKDMMENVKHMSEVAEGLKSLEFQVKKDRESTPGYRGDSEEGYLD